MTQKYGMGYSKTFIDVLKKRCIKTHAQFLIPYLKPGMKILDCGSGPGSMTIDFARYLQRGEVIGVDIEESQIAIATADAKRENVTNVTFQTADVFDLPFADDTFDLVFSQGLLVHLPDPIQALQEQRRVTKKGGIVTARSGYARGAIFHPENALLKEAWLFHNQPLLGCDINHVHILCSFHPKYSIGEIVRKFKSITARELFREYQWLKEELWGGEFWSDGYYVATVGEKGNWKTVERYVRLQGSNGRAVQLRLL